MKSAKEIADEIEKNSPGENEVEYSEIEIRDGKILTFIEYAIYRTFFDEVAFTDEMGRSEHLTAELSRTLEVISVSSFIDDEDTEPAYSGTEIEVQFNNTPTAG